MPDPNSEPSAELIRAVLLLCGVRVRVRVASSGPCSSCVFDIPSLCIQVAVVLGWDTIRSDLVQI